MIYCCSFSLWLHRDGDVLKIYFFYGSQNSLLELDGFSDAVYFYLRSGVVSLIYMVVHIYLLINILLCYRHLYWG